MKHGGFYSGPDGFNPGHLIEHKFEDATVVDKKSWGNRRNIRLEDIKDIHELISDVASIVSCNGNILINVGPTKEGTIIPIFEERLRQLGGWLKVNGEAIYGSRPWIYQNDSISKQPQVWYTTRGDNIYGMVLGWPSHSQLYLGNVKTSESTQITLLGYNKNLEYIRLENGNLEIAFPPMDEFIDNCGKYCQWAYTIKITDYPSKFSQNNFQLNDKYVIVENL